MVTGDLKSHHFLGPPEGTGRGQLLRGQTPRTGSNLCFPCLSHATLWEWCAADWDSEYRGLRKRPQGPDEGGCREELWSQLHIMVCVTWDWVPRSHLGSLPPGLWNEAVFPARPLQSSPRLCAWTLPASLLLVHLPFPDPSLLSPSNHSFLFFSLTPPLASILVL